MSVSHACLPIIPSRLLTSSLQVLATEDMRALRYPQLWDDTALVFGTGQPLHMVFVGIDLRYGSLADAAAEDDLLGGDVGLAGASIGVLPRRHGG